MFLLQRNKTLGVICIEVMHCHWAGFTTQRFTCDQKKTCTVLKLYKIKIINFMSTIC